MPDRYFNAIEKIIRDAKDVKAGVRELSELAEEKVPASLPVWKVLKPLDWAGDVSEVSDAWRDRVRTCVPPEASGIYLGLDGLNMPDGNGIELGASMTHKPGGKDINFIYDCNKYCKDLPMPSLAAFYTWFYRKQGHDTFGKADGRDIEYAVCLGGTALVIRDALRALDPDTLRGKAVERCFAVGFHDGDMLRLGRATAAGFTCDATFNYG